MRLRPVFIFAALPVLATCVNGSATESAERSSTTMLPTRAMTTAGGAPDTAVRSPSTSEPLSPAPTAVLDADDPVDGPVMRYPERSNSDEGMAAEVRGVLELEATCLYIAFDEVGERYPILWPFGTRWDEQDLAVISPAGESMTMGDEVYGGGGYLYVADVERIAGSQASSLAAECVDNTHGEIAIVNNADAAIGPAEP